jgi:hypothetical protein
LEHIKLAGSDFHKAFHLCYGLDHLVTATLYSYLQGAGHIEQIIEEANELIPFYHKHISYILDCINITKRRIQELEAMEKKCEDTSLSLSSSDSTSLITNKNNDNTKTSSLSQSQTTTTTTTTTTTGSPTTSNTNTRTLSSSATIPNYDSKMMMSSLKPFVDKSKNVVVKNGELHNPPLINYTIDEFQHELLYILTKDLRRARHLLNLSLQRRAEAKIFLGQFQSAQEDYKQLQDNIALDQESAESRHTALRQTMFLTTFFKNINTATVSKEVIELTTVIMKAQYLTFDERWNFAPSLNNFLLKNENDMKYFILLYRKKVYGIVDPFREHCLDFTSAASANLEAYFKHRIPQFKQITAANLCQDYLSWTWHDNNNEVDDNNNLWNIPELNELFDGNLEQDQEIGDDVSDDDDVEMNDNLWSGNNDDDPHNDQIDDIER